MENASKALIIAGEILIGVLIISLASYIITMFGGFSRTMNEKMDETQITRFNVNFTNYSNRANISVQEIVSLINLANQNNDEYQASSGDNYFVDVCIDGTSILNKNINEFLGQNKNNTYYYCNLETPRIIKNDNAIEIRTTTKTTDITYNKYTRRVNKINFHPINDKDFINAILQGNKIIWNIK